MAQNTAKKIDEDVALYIKLTPEAAAYLDDYATELDRKTPGLRHTRQDAVRAILGAAVVKHAEKRA